MVKRMHSRLATKSRRDQIGIQLMSNKRTLFAPDFRQHSKQFSATNAPYSVAVKSLASARDGRFDSIELSAISQAAEHDAPLIESRGCLTGAIAMRIGSEEVNCEGDAVPIPVFVEEEGLAFLSHRATGVLLVESRHVFDQLLSADFCVQMPFILITGSGIPRMCCRRLLHRMERELGLRISILTDNDTWGYFIYSVMARGMIAPHMANEYYAIRNPSYVGIKAGEASPQVLRRSKPVWKLRLAELRQYDCFRDAPWPEEFDAFEQQGGGIDVKGYMAEVGTDQFVREYLVPRLKPA